MAILKIKGDFVGPGEEKTAVHLRDHLPAEWTIFAGRKLPGQNRDDVDFIVVGENRVFVLEEKSWGPRIVADDNNWYVGASPRPNPLNRIGQISRKLAGVLRENAKGFKAIQGKPVTGGVILSHDKLQLYAGNNHNTTELIVRLIEAKEELQKLDRAIPGLLGTARGAVIKYLDDLPVADATRQIGEYKILGQTDVPGLETSYLARASDNTEVILKCYPIAQLSEYGDPQEFLKRETNAINRLADVSRTWRAYPFFESQPHGLFVVPVVPPTAGRNLQSSLQNGDPVRADGRLDEEVARKVLTDAYEGLADLHDAGLVHRALHPRRIWLGRRLRVMFSDLHLARIEGDVSIALWAPDSDISEDYRAPECAASVGLARPGSDVYSLALCLVEWLLGTDATALSLAEINDRVELAWPWAAPVLAGLSPNLEDRPAAAEVVVSLTPPRGAVADLPVPPTEFGEGALIGSRYEIKRKLGRGGFATTWLAYDKQAQQSKVLKEFRHAIPDQLVKEYRAADQLHHDRCGRVYDIQATELPHYLVSEYVAGNSLGELPTPPSVEDIRKIGQSICQALTYIHGHDLVHGDVTPANIIVPGDNSDLATLIDFGLSVPVGDRPAGWNPIFAAPEVVSGRPASSASDIFGIASSLIHTMLGRRAMRSRSEDSEPELEPPSDAENRQWGADGKALLKVLFGAVAADPKDRPKSAEALAELIRTTEPDIQDSTREADPLSHDETLRPRTNLNVGKIRRLYRASSAGNAGNRGLDDDFAKNTYVATLLDSHLTPQVLSGSLSVVLLSGNPGDGKTSILVRLADELRTRGANEEHIDEAGWRLRLDGHLYIAVYDASESHGDLSSDDLVSNALRPIADADEGSATALIAVNDGRLLQYFTDHSDEFEDWKWDIEDQFAGADPGDSGIVLVDLKRRSLASTPGEAGLASRALAALTRIDLWDVCAGCSAKSVCPILENRRILDEAGADAFSELILMSHLRRRRRATFRDVRSAAAWIITGDRDCEDIHAMMAEGRNPRFLPDAHVYDLAFSKSSSDYLVKEWSALDPASAAAPLVDAIRRSGVGDPGHELGRYRTVRSVARALYFGDWGTDDSIDRGAVRAYRYLEEFLGMLRDEDPSSLPRILLGISRLVGAFGFQDPGLAMSSGPGGIDWAVLHTVPEEYFDLLVEPRSQQYVESMPDQLILRHKSGNELRLTLDTAEVILRAADGELVNDPGSDAIRQEIDAFAGQLRRQPSDSALVVDASGSTAIAKVEGTTITLELS